MRLPKIQVSVIHLHGPEKPEVRLPPPPRKIEDLERDAWVLDAHTRVKAWKFAAMGVGVGAFVVAIVAAAPLWLYASHLKNQQAAIAKLSSFLPPRPASARPGPAPLPFPATVVPGVVPGTAVAALPAPAAASSPVPLARPQAIPGPVAAAIPSAPSAQIPAPQAASSVGQSTPAHAPPVPVAPPVATAPPALQQVAVAAPEPAKPVAKPAPAAPTKPAPKPAAPAKPAVKSAPSGAATTAKEDGYFLSDPVIFTAQGASVKPAAPQQTAAPSPSTRKPFRVVGVPVPDLVLIEVSPGSVIPFRKGDTLPDGRVLRSATPGGGINAD